MSLRELFPTLRALDHADKFRALQYLVFELARDEQALLSPEVEYPVWSPHDAYDAALVLLDALDVDRSLQSNA